MKLVILFSVFITSFMLEPELSQNELKSKETDHVASNDNVSQAQSDIAATELKQQTLQNKNIQLNQLRLPPVPLNDTTILSIGLPAAMAQTPETPRTQEQIETEHKLQVHKDALNECKNGVAEYQTELKEFNSACGDASLGGRDTSCKEQIELCFKCAGIGAKKAREQKKLADECGTLEKEAFLPIRNSHQQTALTSLLDLANGRAPMLQAQTPRRPIQTASLPMKTYQNCPAYAARDLETIEDKLREDEKEKNRIDSEVKRLERDVSRKETEIKREEAKFEQKINGLKKSFEQQNDALMKVKTEEFEGLQNTLNELVDGLQKLSMARLEAQQKHEDEMQKSVLERCLIQSKSKVQKEREQQLKQISAQTYKTSSLRSLLKRADMSQSKRSRSQLSKYAKACRGSESTQLIVTRLKRAYKTQQNVLNSKEEQIKQMYKTTIDKIGQVQPALQQELKRLQQQQMQSLQEAQTFFVKNQQLLQEELANLKRQLQELLFELQFIESQHAYRAGLASKLQSYSAGAKGERANVYSKISSQYSSLENAYGSAVSQCNCEDAGNSAGVQGASDTITSQMSNMCKKLNKDTEGDDTLLKKSLYEKNQTAS